MEDTIMAKKTSEKKSKRIVSFKDSISTKLIAVMLLVVIIPLVISVAVSYKTSTSKALDDAYESLNWQARYIQSEFNGIVNNNIMTMQAVAMSPTTVNFMEKMDNPIYLDKELRYLQSVDDKLADGNLTVLTGGDGMQVLRTKGDYVDVSKREYFTEAMKGNTHVSDIIISASTGVRQMTISVPIVGSEGTVIGIVQRNYDLNEFHKFLSEQSGTAFITDRTGAVAAHSLYEITAENEEDRSQSEFMTSGQTEGVYSEGNEVISYVRDDTTGWTVCTVSNLNSIKKQLIIRQQL
jgi:methyl-accepting chemotaxis protein